MFSLATLVPMPLYVRASGANTSNMSDSRTRRFMRMALEWCAYGFASLAVGSLVYWIVMATASLGSTDPLWGPGSVVLRIERGSLVLGSGLHDSLQSLEATAKYQGGDLISDRELAVPGLHCRVQRSWLHHGLNSQHQLIRGSAHWALEISLLLVAITAGTMAVICFCRYRAIGRIPRISNGTALFPNGC
jgi:hypothetical protein